MNALSNLPPLKDRLEIDHEDLRSEIAAALEAVNDITINSDEDVLIARDSVMPLKVLADAATAAHKAEKQPWLEGGREVDRFFKALRLGLDSTIATISASVSEHQGRKLEEARRKAAEAVRVAAFLDEKPPEPPAPAAATRVSDGGAVVASGSVRWDFEITDVDALPRDLLTPNLPAIKARVAGLKATVGITEAAGAIPGVRIFEKVSTVFR